jgi:hypothetical protein
MSNDKIARGNDLTAQDYEIAKIGKEMGKMGENLFRSLLSLAFQGKLDCSGFIQKKEVKT